jgi:Reverse transcriptase (RNA-dependent DNA polymerase)
MNHLLIKIPNVSGKHEKIKFAQTSNKIMIEHNLSDCEASNQFAIFKKKTSSPNCSNFDNEYKMDYTNKLPDYVGNKLMANKFSFTAEILAFAVDKIGSGKSAGFDSLTIEHVLHCHPVIYSIYAKLFNIMLAYSFVPTDFGRGVTIPIPKNDNCRGMHAIDSFRGITLSPIISKVFEHCILILFSDYFSTSNNQFGFKTKVGCPHAIYTLRKVVDHYVNNNSTVNLCFLDMEKGFDKINHSVLLLKLMKRRVPVALVKLLQYWYSISYNSVRWGDALSQPYKLLAGVRQGGVLSPVLFSVYVDELLNKFNKSGCCFMGLTVSALMYADDLV